MTAWQDACVSFAIGMTGSDIRGGYDNETAGVARREGGGLGWYVGLCKNLLIGSNRWMEKCKPHDRALRT